MASTSAAGAQNGTASSGSVETSVGSTIFARLHPQQYLSRFLALSLRPDGRNARAWRGTTVAPSSISSAQGSSMVRLGGTVIVAGVKAEIVDTTQEPEEEEDDEDSAEAAGRLLGRRLVPNVDLGPMASARFRPGPPGQEAQVVSHQLYHILSSCPPLDARSLTIERGHAAWCLYVDLVCIAYDGNVLDAALLALMTALRETSLPATRFDVDELRVICDPDPATARRLELKSLPLACSFGIVDGAHLLCDPNAFESTLTSASVVVALNALRETDADTDEEEEELMHVETSGLAKARITHEEMHDANLAPSATGDQSDATVKEAPDGSSIIIKDEALIQLCVQRAKARCHELRSLVLSSSSSPQ